MLLLVVWVCARPLTACAAEEEGTKRVAIIPFALPMPSPEREWLSEGLPHVVALRLQQLGRVRVAVLPPPDDAGTRSSRQHPDSGDIAPFLERVRAQGYDVVLFGHFQQIDTTLRLESNLWGTRPERHMGKIIDQSPERDPDALGAKLATSVATMLQLAGSDMERRRLEERFTTSAEALERFARALVLTESPGGGEEIAQAVTLLTEAYTLDGKFSMARRHLADLHLRREQYASAVEAYQSLLNLVRRDPRIFRSLGTAYFAQGDTQRAIDVFRRGIQIDPRDAQLHLNLGLAYAAAREYEKATRALLRTLEFAPDDPLAFANLGVVYLLQGNFAAATSSLRRAQVLQGSDARLSYNLGLALLFERAYEPARAQFEQALQEKPDFAAAAYQLAMLYERIDAREAVERWKQYLELARKVPGEEAWIPLAQEHLKDLQRP